MSDCCSAWRAILIASSAKFWETQLTFLTRFIFLKKGEENFMTCLELDCSSRCNSYHLFELSVGFKGFAWLSLHLVHFTHSLSFKSSDFRFVFLSHFLCLSSPFLHFLGENASLIYRLSSDCFVVYLIEFSCSKEDFFAFCRCSSYQAAPTHQGYLC